MTSRTGRDVDDVKPSAADAEVLNKAKPQITVTQEMIGIVLMESASNHGNGNLRVGALVFARVADTVVEVIVDWRVLVLPLFGVP
jgi:hypothetical protein